MVVLAKTVGGEWRPGIGDPTFMGWLIVACYFTAALLCFRAWQTERRIGGRIMCPGFWAGLTVLIVLLGINKQLDLQSYLTVLGRRLAVAQGWYARHRTVQTVFIAAIAFAAFVSVAAMCWVVRRNLRRYGLAVVGAIYLAAFVVIRAASFHHVDQMLGLRFQFVSVNHVMELGGNLCIALGAWRAGRIGRAACPG